MILIIVNTVTAANFIWMGYKIRQRKIPFGKQIGMTLWPVRYDQTIEFLTELFPAIAR